MRVGETLLVRFIGTNSGFIHPMHIHGGPFRIVETDGNPVPPDGQWVKGTVNVGPGERYDGVPGRRENRASGSCTATLPTTRPTTMSRSRAAVG